MTRRDVRDLSRDRDEAELFYADLVGIRPRSNPVRTRPTVAPPFWRRAAPQPPLSAELAETEPYPLSYPEAPAYDAESDPPSEVDPGEDDTGEAVPMMNLEAEAGGDESEDESESEMDDQSPVPLEELLAIDTSEIVESWDDRSSAT
jgi:hypothetical protein